MALDDREDPENPELPAEAKASVDRADSDDTQDARDPPVPKHPPAEPASPEPADPEPAIPERVSAEPDGGAEGHVKVDGDRGDDAEPVEPVIEVAALNHEFRGKRSGFLRRPFRRPRIRAIDGMSFTINPGEAVGYLGSQGVGKTTMVELLTGILTPTSGLLRTCGLIPGRGGAKLTRKIGVVFGHRPQLWPDLPLTESLRILAAMHRLPERQWRARRTELVERLALASFIDLPIGQLSASRRMRGEIAAALLHEPELVVLDEPTAGLDVRSKEWLRSFLGQEHRVHGRTILITSSRIGDVERLCDRLLVVDGGRLAYDGDLGGLIDRTDAQRVLVVDLNEANKLLDDVPGTKLFAVEAGGLRQRLSFSAGNVSTARVLADVAARAAIRNLSLEEPPIEDVVRRLAAVD